MKNIIITGISILLLIACNQNQIGNKNGVKQENASKSISFNRIQDSIAENDKILSKDTLFSIFTSNIEDNQIKDLLAKIMTSNKNFVVERRLFSNYKGTTFNDPSHYYNQNCYEFVFNGESYLFDIGFDHMPLSVEHWSEQYSTSDKLDYISLYYKSEKESSLIEDVINLYKGKYGECKKNVEFYEFNQKAFFTKKEFKTPSFKTKKDIYSWKSRPNMKIEYFTNQRLRDNYTGEKKNETYYEIIIIYYSKAFLARWKENNSLNLKNNQEELQRKKSLFKKDI
jgi:hypothetical protein